MNELPPLKLKLDLTDDDLRDFLGPQAPPGSLRELRNLLRGFEIEVHRADAAARRLRSAFDAFTWRVEDVLVATGALAELIRKREGIK
jgi:hypothetical protein